MIENPNYKREAAMIREMAKMFAVEHNSKE
jgi:hypothetical protein